MGKGKRLNGKLPSHAKAQCLQPLHLRYTLILLLLLPALGGCLNLARQPAATTEYYTLAYDPPHIAGLSTQLPHIVRIERFNVAPVYNSNKIIFQEGPYQTEAYNYHKWQSNPGDLAAYFLARDMAHSALFKAVFASSGATRASHILAGTVDEFYERRDKGRWEAVLSLRVTLLTDNEPDISKRVLLQTHYRQYEDFSPRSPAAFAEAMSRAMAKLSERITTDIYQKLVVSKSN